MQSRFTEMRCRLIHIGMRPLLALALIAASCQANADPALRFVVVIYQDVVDVTQKMVATCVWAHPELAAQGATAFGSWLRRNANDAKRLADWFQNELLAKFPSPAERNQALANVAENKRQFEDEWSKQVRDGGIAGCKSYLEGLENKVSDIAHMLRDAK